jgi:predicted secreted protein
MKCVLGTLVAAVAIGWANLATADLCPKCRELMFVDSVGKCEVCGAATTSGALRLCPKCSARLHECEHCRAKLAAAESSGGEAVVEDHSEKAPAEGRSESGPQKAADGKSAAEKAAGGKPAAPGSLSWRPVGEKPADTAAGDSKPAAPDVKLSLGPSPAELPPGGAVPIEKLPAVQPPAEPQPQAVPATPLPRIDATRSGIYTEGKWQYRLEITEPGTPGEGRWGSLRFNGQKLPRGQVNDYYRTPWGPLYWVDVPPARFGLHGWMPAPLGQSPRQGHPLAVPPALLAAAAGPQSQPAASPGTAAAPRRPQTLELTKIHDKQRAKVYVGNLIVIRLKGNPTTGYQWAVGRLAGQVVRLIGPPQYVPTPYSPSRLGSGGTYVFTFQVIRGGTGSIQLVYARSWEKGQAPVDAFTIGVDVYPNPLAPPARPPQRAAY